MPDLETVLIRKVKRPVGCGLWAAYVIGEDAFGVWLYSPIGSRYQGSDGQRISICEVGQGKRDSGRPVVQLIRPNAWWTATWTGGGVELPISVDICTPPTRNGDEWEYTDLELDPFLRADGTVGTDDWDEFLEAYASGLIAKAEHDAARHATATIEQCLRERTEPFGDSGYARLESAMATPLPPLVDLNYH